MRIAAALTGVAGALLGIIISATVVMITLSIMGSIGGFGFYPVDVMMIGIEVAIVLFCAAALTGAGFLATGRGWRSITLMLVAAIGIVVVRVIQPLLISVAGSIGIPERFAAEPSPVGAGLSIQILLPTIALLLACALGAYAIRRERA